MNSQVPRIREAKYKIVQCENCQFYFIEPTIDLTTSEWKLLYENNYFIPNNKWTAQFRSRERRARIHLISQNTRKPIKRFLDIGCGRGEMLREALHEGWETYGLDIADNLDNALKNRTSFFLGNLAEAAYPDDFFDVIYMNSVLEHMPDPLRSLKEINRILTSGGILYLVVPNEDCLSNDLKRIVYTMFFQSEMYGRIKPFVSPYHINGFNKKSLASALRLSGFNVLHLRDFGGTIKSWRFHGFLSRNYLLNLFLYPINLISVVTRQQIQLETLAMKV